MTSLFAPPLADPDELCAAAGFFLWPGYTGPRLRRARERFGSAVKAFVADERGLAEIWKSDLAADFARYRDGTSPEDAFVRLEKLGVSILLRGFAGYPPLLAEISSPPEILAVRGDFPTAERTLVAVVGPRAPSVYGREVTETFTRELARAGVVIVSGLALGTDTIAHRAAVSAGGRTVCVLGCGIDRVYPASHAGFADEIVRDGSGCVVSEYPPGVEPRPEFFPARNRIVAGMSRGAFAPEAAAESGSLITLKFALEENRDVFACPGSVFSPTSAGTNALLREGAIPALAASDILDHLGISPAAAASVDSANLPEEDRRLLAAISPDGSALGEIATALGIPAPAVSGRLVLLQIRGLALELGGGRWRRMT